MESSEPKNISFKGLITGSCLIALVTLAVYIPAMRAGFIWDDNQFLTENQLIMANDGLCRFWCTTEAPDYFPLTSTTLWFEWRLWGMNASGYHAVNVALHILSSILIWLVLNRLKIPGSLLAGIIFAVHPVNVESVAWVTERKNTLPMVFYLLSIFLYLRFEKERHRWLYGISLLSFLLALLSKTSVVMLPLVLLGCAWWQRDKIVRKDVLRTVPFFVLAGILGLVTIWFQYHQAIGEDIVRSDSLFSRLAIAGWAVWFYLYKAIFPLNLSFVYPRWEVGNLHILSFMPGLMFLGLLILFWSYRKTWGRPFLFGLGYYVVTLLPVLGFLNIYFMKYSLVANHWQYTSIIGVIALGVGLGSYHYNDWQKSARRVGITCAALLVAIFCFQSWRLGHVYRNVETLWRDTIAKNPRCWMAQNNLANFLKKEGRVTEAIDHYHDALRIRPGFEEAHYNLGNALASEGKLDEAVAQYNKALRIRPDAVEVHVNLGNALARKGRTSDAIAHYNEALKIMPGFGEAHYNLGNALASEGKLDDAIAHYREALRIRPDFVKWHYKLANALASEGRSGEAISEYEEALKRDPDYVEAHVSLGNALASEGRPGEAIDHYKEALRIRPDSEEAHNNLGVALVRKGKVDEALYHFREALRINPDYADARTNLGRVLDTRLKPINKGIAKIEEALETNPDDPVLHYNLGRLYERKGGLDEATGQYKKALSIQPGFIPALNSLALVYTAKMQYDMAISMFKRIISLRPDASGVYYNIACVFAMEKRKKDSIEWLKKAINRGYNNWEMIKTDEDLKNIRDSSYYRELIENH